MRAGKVQGSSRMQMGACTWGTPSRVLGNTSHFSRETVA